MPTRTRCETEAINCTAQVQQRTLKTVNYARCVSGASVWLWRARVSYRENWRARILPRESTRCIASRNSPPESRHCHTVALDAATRCRKFKRSYSSHYHAAFSDASLPEDVKIDVLRFLSPDELNDCLLISRSFHSLVKRNDSRLPGRVVNVSYGVTVNLILLL